MENQHLNIKEIIDELTDKIKDENFSISKDILLLIAIEFAKISIRDEKTSFKKIKEVINMVYPSFGVKRSTDKDSIFFFVLYLMVALDVVPIEKQTLMTERVTNSWLKPYKSV